MQIAIATLLGVSGAALLGFLGSGLVSGVSSFIRAIGRIPAVLEGVLAKVNGFFATIGNTLAELGVTGLGVFGALALGIGASAASAYNQVHALTNAGDSLKGTFSTYEEASEAVQQLTAKQKEYEDILHDINSSEEQIAKAATENIKVKSQLAVATEEMNRLQAEGIHETTVLAVSEEEAGKQASTLASHVNSATRELEAYKQSLSEMPDYSSALKENVSIAKDLGKQYREGTLSYDEAMSALEFFGIDKSSINTAKQFEEALAGIFNGSAYKILTSYDPYKTMATSMKELADHGEDVGATFKWVNGELVTDVTSWEKLSQATGLTRGQLEAIIAPLQETSSGFIAMTADAEEALNNIEGLNLQNGVAQFGTLQEAVEKLGEANQNLDTVQIEAYIDKLKEAGLINIGDLDQFLGKDGKIDWEAYFAAPAEGEIPELEVRAKLAANQIEVEETFGTLDTPEVEVTGKVTKIDDSEIGGGEFGELEESPKVEVGLEANTESLEEVWGTLDEIEDSAENIEVNVEADTGEVEEAEESVTTLNEMEVTEKKLSVDYSDAEAGAAAWQYILDMPAETHKYEYIHVITITEGGGGGVGARAKGVKSSQGETALVNDGAPVNGSQAELIVQDGRAFIAHGGKTGIVDLKKGATVYTAAETQAILRKKGMKEEDFYGGVSSFADGKLGDIGYKPTSGLGSTDYYKGYAESKDVNWESAVFRFMGYSEEDIAAEHKWFSKWGGGKESAERLIKELKHYRAMDIINEEEYYRTLYVINEGLLKDFSGLQDEYWKHQEEIYKHQSEALDDIIEKEEKLNELAKAKTQKILVYKDGMYQYIQNTEAISKAQRNVYGYANGTTGASGGLSLVGENGPELRVLGQGDGVIPSDITKNLMRMGSMSMGALNNSVGDMYNFNIDTVKLENVNDVEGLFNGLKNLAIQRTTAKA